MNRDNAMLARGDAIDIFVVRTKLGVQVGLLDDPQEQSFGNDPNSGIYGAVIVRLND